MKTSGLICRNIMVRTLLCSFFIEVMYFRSVSTFCVSSAATGCIEGGKQAKQEYERNPTSDTISKLCKAVDDMWSCLVRNRCDVPELKSEYEVTKLACTLAKAAHFGGSILKDAGLINNENIFGVSVSVTQTPNWRAFLTTVRPKHYPDIPIRQRSTTTVRPKHYPDIPILYNPDAEDRYIRPYYYQNYNYAKSTTQRLNPTEKPRQYNHDAEDHYRRSYYYQYYNSAESMSQRVVTSLALNLALISLVYRSLFHY